MSRNKLVQAVSSRTDFHEGTQCESLHQRDCRQSLHANSGTVRHLRHTPTICVAVEFNRTSLVTLKREAVHSTETSENLSTARFEKPK